MRKISFLITVLSLIGFGSLGAVSIPGFDQSGGDKIVLEGQFIVRFASKSDISGVAQESGLYRLGVASVDKIMDNHQVSGVRSIFPASATDKSDIMSRFYLISLPEGQDDEAFMEAMRADPNVVSIENDIACRIKATPNDTDYGDQWHLYQTSRRDIHAPEAWDIQTGRDTVIIAIIDTGVNFEHGDLAPNIWVNPGEDVDNDLAVFDSTDINSTDDDANGYVDDFVGYDFISNTGASVWEGEDGAVPDNNPNDFNGHGTHCAGIAAAATNNSLGGAGVAGGWSGDFSGRGVRIMCLRAGYSAPDPEYGYETGYLVMSAVAEAMNYAVNNGADIISFSAGSSYTTALASALNNVRNNGVLFFAAAGNDGSSIPGSYFDTEDSVISVAWTTINDTKASSSNYGLWVEVAAPGSSIYSTYSYHYQPTYDALSGTSMACPCAAGVAALIKSHYPDYSLTELYNAVINSADPLDGETYYVQGFLGSGRVNAYNHLQNAPIADFTADVLVGNAPLTVNFTDMSPAATSWDWDFGDGGSSPDQNPLHEYTDPGLYDVSLAVVDPNGSYSDNKKRYIYLPADTLYGDTAYVNAGESFALPVKISNTVALDELTLVFNYNGLTYDSFTVAGTRGETFANVTRTNSYQTRMTFHILTSANSGQDQLLPGDNTIMNLWFTGSGGTESLDTATLSGKSTSFVSPYHAFVPAYIPAVVIMGLRGDANGDGTRNIADASYIINAIFFGGNQPSDYGGDANGDGTFNIADASYLINWIFFGGPEPPQ